MPSILSPCQIWRGTGFEFPALNTKSGTKTTMATTATTNNKPIKPTVGGWADLWRPWATMEFMLELLQGFGPSWSVLCWVFHTGHYAAGSRQLMQTYSEGLKECK